MTFCIHATEGGSDVDLIAQEKEGEDEDTQKYGGWCVRGVLVHKSRAATQLRVVTQIPRLS